jgi:hypothetical protein
VAASRPARVFAGLDELFQHGSTTDQHCHQTHVIVKHYKDPAAVSAHGRKLIADLKDLTEGRPEVRTLVWVSGKHP